MGGHTAAAALGAGGGEDLSLPTLTLSLALGGAHRGLSLAFSQSAAVNLAQVQASPRVANLLFIDKNISILYFNVGHLVNTPPVPAGHLPEVWTALTLQSDLLQDVVALVSPVLTIITALH